MVCLPGNRPRPTKVHVKMHLYICEKLNYATQTRAMRTEATGYLGTETNPVALTDYALNQKDPIPNGSLRCGAVVFRQLYPGY